MDTFTVIPAIDLLSGKVVRLKQGDYNQVQYFDQTPGEFAGKFEKAGASRIHIVDLDGAKDSALINYETIKEIRKSVKCKIELGGGIRSLTDVERYFDLGIDFIILGSLLTKDLKTTNQIIEKYPKKIIAGFDARDGYVSVAGWTETSKLSVEDMIKNLNIEKFESIIFTDIATDGMMTGPNLKALDQISKLSPIPIIASGGIRDLSDIEAVSAMQKSGVMGCIIGKAVLSGLISLDKLF